MNNLPETLVEAVRHFSDTKTCVEFMAGVRWPNGVECPHCGSKEVRFISTRNLWECKSKHPKRQFSVKVGSVFEDSALPLDKILIAIWLEANCKNSISSYELARNIGVTQKSAWFLQHRIRLAMQTGSFRKLGGPEGEVEVDESYIGGRARNMHAGKRKAKGTGPAGKAIVQGILERTGADRKSTVRAFVVGDAKRPTLQGNVRQHVAAGTQVFTDALLSYHGLSADYVHGVIDHLVSYVKGNIHTNGLENFWSLFKRCVKGTHVAIEPFHLFRYLDAEAFRFNNRGTSDAARFLMVACGVFDKRLTYKSLIGEADKVVPTEVA